MFESLKDKRSKTIVFICVMILGLSTISWIFWEEELKYSLPTPKPDDYVEVRIGQKLELNKYFKLTDNKPVFLHFFNPKCPCSKFNADEFQTLVKKFNGKIDFKVILQNSELRAISDFENKYNLKIPVLLDSLGEISDACGIYSTPQAVILNSKSEIYYKGNYNKSRFCNDTKTKFVEMSLNYLFAGQPLPAYTSEATTPYGCSLPSDTKKK